MFRFLLLYLGFLSVDSACAFLVPNGRTTVQTPVGEIVGFTSTVIVGGRQRTVRNYLGIPFAEPPINSARFRKPIPKASFSSPFDASKFGHACFQFEGKFKANENISFSEDCLTLNIFAPEELPGDVKLYPGKAKFHQPQNISESLKLRLSSKPRLQIVISFGFEQNVCFAKTENI